MQMKRIYFQLFPFSNAIIQRFSCDFVLFKCFMHSPKSFHPSKYKEENSHFYASISAYKVKT